MAQADDGERLLRTKIQTIIYLIQFFFFEIIYLIPEEEEEEETDF